MVQCIDAACCYRRVAWFVCRSVTIVSNAKMAEPIEMFGSGLGCVQESMY